MKIWMSNKQIETIQSYLDNDMIVLEYGAGGSTAHFANFVKTYVSIEHDINWINKLKQHLPSNVELYYCPPNNNIKLPVWEGKEKDFLNYINYIDNIQYKKYDVVIIDGRARQFCAIKILNYIDNNTLVFFHDFFERERYHFILDNYNILNLVGSSPSLAILQKK